MLIVLGIFIIASVFEVIHLIRRKEKKEAAVYLCIAAAALALSVYLALTSVFTSFAATVFRLFGIE